MTEQAMNNQNINKEDGDQATSFGEFLRQARERKNLSVNQVASQLRVTDQQIDDLENSQTNVFSTPVYTRAHVRRYAKLLGLDEEKVIALFNKEAGLDTSDKITRVTVAVPAYSDQGSSSSFFKWILWIIAVAIVAAACYYGYNYYQTGSFDFDISKVTSVFKSSEKETPQPAENEKEKEKPKAEAPAANAPVQPAEKNEELTAAEQAKKQEEIKARIQAEIEQKVKEEKEAKAREERILAEQEAARKAKELAEASTVLKPMENSEGSFQVVMPGKAPDSVVKVTITGEKKGSWFGIYKNGKLVSNNVLKDGTSRVLEFELPFKVSVGNRLAASVVLDNHPIDLSADPNKTSYVFTALPD